MKKIVYIAAAFAVTAVVGVQLALPDSAIRFAPWPLYSKIFPFSALIESDVATARDRMNLSRWQSYNNDEKSALLSEIGSVVRNHVMPPGRYTLVHPAARLSTADANEIYQWTRTERHLLQISPELSGE